MLASDLDGTVIPKARAVEHDEALAAFRGAMTRCRPELGLAYVTGRTLGSALDGMDRWQLPLPDFLGCDVGTSVYRREGTRYLADDAFADRLREALGDTDAGPVREVVAAVEGVEVQDDAQQGTFKASFSFEWARRTDVARAVRAALDDTGLHVDLVLSRDLFTGVGLLDAIPAGGAKDRAVHWMAEALGLDTMDVVFAGDSGNDEAALLSGVRAILVGNATSELKEHVRRAAERRGLEDLVYLAEGACAAGVVEGLEHFGVCRG